MDTLIACFSCVVFLSYCVQGMSQNACTALSDGKMPKKNYQSICHPLFVENIIADSVVVQMMARAF